MLRINTFKGLDGDGNIMLCLGYKGSSQTCRSGAPFEGVDRGSYCPFSEEDQYLCANYEIDV